jgi:hypothetical protein
MSLFKKSERRLMFESLSAKVNEVRELELEIKRL